METITCYKKRINIALYVAAEATCAVVPKQKQTFWPGRFEHLATLWFK